MVTYWCGWQNLRAVFCLVISVDHSSCSLANVPLVYSIRSIRGSMKNHRLQHPSKFACPFEPRIVNSIWNGVKCEISYANLYRNVVELIIRIHLKKVSEFQMGRTPIETILLVTSNWNQYQIHLHSQYRIYLDVIFGITIWMRIQSLPNSRELHQSVDVTFSRSLISTTEKFKLPAFLPYWCT